MSLDWHRELREELSDIARRYGEEIEMEHDLTEGSGEPDPTELHETVKVARDVEVPEEIEERLKRERDDEGEELED